MSAPVAGPSSGQVLPTQPLSIPVCGSSNAPLLLSNGFTMCAGTPGDGESRGNILNSEPLHAQQMVAFYNMANSYNSDSEDFVNPCITQGIPSQTDPTEWNAVGYTDAQGCCSTEYDWNAAGLNAAASNYSRATALTPFTTASGLGKNNADNLKNGMPDGLGALTKVWGFNLAHWVHGGVHADNCGLWYAPKTKFTIKYNKETWTQDYLLWSRQTGDNYQIKDDPFGVLCPAPNGNWAETLALDTTKTQEICTWCPIDASALGGKYSNKDANTACVDPFYQTCKLLHPLNEAYMIKAGYMGSDSPLPIDQKYQNIPKSPQKNGYQNPKGRVGGIFASNQMYGPGKFTVLANLPPTAPNTKDSPLAQKGFPMVDPVTGKYPSKAPTAVPGGRGYVFAMWTFSYTEAYEASTSSGKVGIPGDASHPHPTSYAFGNPCTNGKNDTIQSSCNLSSTQSQSSPQHVEGNEQLGDNNIGGGYSTDSLRSFPNIPGLVQGSADDGYWATHNHEIDIEIPSNSAEFQALDSFDKIGLNTANFNTWLTDDNSYTAGALALYQQAQATAPDGKFFCAVGPEDDEDTYHEYTFVWFVDPATSVIKPDNLGTYTDNSYVAFYLDGTEVYRCKRFVPRRSGRVLIGLWPAWWGSIYQPMDFNQVYCKIARMEFVPQADYTNTPFEKGSLVTNGSQMFDQFLPTTGAEIACDMGVMANRLPVNIDGILSSPSPGIKLWVVIVICIGVAVVFGGLSWLLTYRILKKNAAAAAAQSTATTAAASSI
jgi:hypothetical protein